MANQMSGVISAIDILDPLRFLVVGWMMRYLPKVSIFHRLASGQSPSWSLSTDMSYVEGGKIRLAVVDVLGSV